jgi:hypothetical protein
LRLCALALIQTIHNSLYAIDRASLSKIDYHSQLQPHQPQISECLSLEDGIVNVGSLNFNDYLMLNQ